ncbi:DNA primase [Methylacidiphilum caldifontis]|uniref:DNA primase n=1 Tax=Methylacidiphilum caldifontis TaxID=2795386 RepID=UPI001FC9A2CB|nr:toprim domain-containing protein [Methylacidiphilum caldifontis]
MEIAKAFGLGYAPNKWDGLLRWASGKKDYLELLEPAGLVVRTESSKIYDRFRGRLIFRISDETGKIVGFSGRLIEGDKGPKYLNSPESPIFTKGKILYGFHKAKTAIAESGKAILCEGHIDLIRLHAVQFSMAVATQGTALTEYQAALLKRFCSEVIVAYDGDRAGEDAAIRALDILLAEGLEVKIAQLPPGEDPDSLISKNGREAFEKLIENALPYPTFVLNKACREYSPQQALGKSKIAEKMVGILIKINDPIRRHTACLEVAARLGISLEVFEKKLEQLSSTTSQFLQQDREEQEEQQVWEEKICPAVLESFWFLMEYPGYIARFKEIFAPDVLSDIPGGDLLLRLYDSGKESVKRMDVNHFLETLPLEQKRSVVSFMFDPARENQEGYAQEEHFMILKDQLLLLWTQKRLEKIKLQIELGKISGKEISTKLKEIVDLRKKLL